MPRYVPQGVQHVRLRSVRTLERLYGMLQDKKCFKKDVKGTSGRIVRYLCRSAESLEIILSLSQVCSVSEVDPCDWHHPSTFFKDLQEGVGYVPSAYDPEGALKGYPFPKAAP